MMSSVPRPMYMLLEYPKSGPVSRALLKGP